MSISKREKPREQREPIPPLPDHIPPPKFLIPVRGMFAFTKCGYRCEGDHVILWQISQCCAAQVVPTMVGNICRRCEASAPEIVLGRTSRLPRAHFAFELDGE